MKIAWRRIVKTWLPPTLGLVLLTGGLFRCAGGGYVAGPRTPPPYDGEGYGWDDLDGGDFDENNDENSGADDRESGSENGEGEGADRH